MSTDLQKTNVDAAARDRPECWSQRVIGEASGNHFFVVHRRVEHSLKADGGDTP